MVCPICKHEMKIDTSMVLTTYPSQYGAICPHCGHTDSIYCSEVSLQERFGNSIKIEPDYKSGWVCPKCGAVMNPDMQNCVNCTGNKNINFTCITTPTATPETATKANYSLGGEDAE